MAKQAMPSGEIRPQPFTTALGERYLSYALSTIMARSLPDVRDGLKPVHRRLIYAMRQLRLDPGAGFKKCARVVGDVVGRYHPHGDAAVYDTLVRLAQDFAVRYPLVEGQGNFGNIDGDNAAAMRYTEARMTAVAEALLDGLDENAVDFRTTYDGQEEEPAVLPAGFPNLLANGASGIAVGMASSIPPHNAAEVCDALLHLIKHPQALTETLVELMPGPDFPTGGELVEPRATLIEAYRSGRGSFRLRASWSVEKLSHGQYLIVVTEIPYQVAKSRLIERIAELLNARKVPWLADVRDESADDVRIVLEPRSRSVDPGALMEALFRLTDLEVRIPLNMNVLDAQHVPSVMDLRAVLRAFLDHRHQVLERRTRFRLDKIERRLELVAGYLAAFFDLDEVIRIVRENDEPKPLLMRTLAINETQAEAILNLRLRALRRLEEEALRREHEGLVKEKAELARLLADERRRWKRIAEEIRDVRARFGPDTALGRRRTRIGTPPSAEVVRLETLVEAEPLTIAYSEKGWIRAIRGHVADAEIRYKEGDRERWRLQVQSTDRLYAFATNGRFYTLACDKLARGRGFGEPMRLMIDLGNEDDLVTLIAASGGRKFLVASSVGRGFLVDEADVFAQTRAGRQVLNLGAGEEAAFCEIVQGDAVAVLGDNRKLLIFALDEVPSMSRGRGVRLQKYRDGGLADLRVFDRAAGLVWRTSERARSQGDLEPWLGKRGQAGRTLPKAQMRKPRAGPNPKT